MVLLLFGFDVWGFCFPLVFGRFDISYDDELDNICSDGSDGDGSWLVG